MRVEKFFLSGLFVLLAGLLILYGGYNRPAFKVLPEKALHNAAGAPAGMPPRHTNATHK
jgi:hypothetical protein